MVPSQSFNFGGLFLERVVDLGSGEGLAGSIIIVGWFCGSRFLRTCALSVVFGTPSSIARSITEIHTAALSVPSCCPEALTASSFSIIHTLSDWRNECSLGRGRPKLTAHRVPAKGVSKMHCTIRTPVSILILLLLFSIPRGGHKISINGFMNCDTVIWGHTKRIILLTQLTSQLCHCVIMAIFHL